MLRAVGVLLRALARAVVPTTCRAMLVDALLGKFRKDKALAELQRFLIGDETTLTVADGHLVVPPADAKRTSYKAFAKCDARVVLRASAMLRECTKFEFARNAAEIELLQALGRLSGQDIVEISPEIRQTE
jgi:hypothetical protein